MSINLSIYLFIFFKTTYRDATVLGRSNDSPVCIYDNYLNRLSPVDQVKYTTDHSVWTFHFLEGKRKSRFNK